MPSRLPKNLEGEPSWNADRTVPYRPAVLSWLLHSNKVPSWLAVGLAGVAFAFISEMSIRLFRLPPLNFAVFWPPAGLGLAVFLAARRSLWPALFSVFFGLEAIGAWQIHSGWEVTFFWPLSDVAKMILGAWMIQAVLKGPIRLTRLTEVWVLVGLGALLAPMVTAPLGVAATTSWQQTEPIGQRWVYWWLADTLGVLLMAPFFLTLRVPPLPHARRLLEGAALMGSLVLTTELLLRTESSEALRLPLPYITFFFLIWAALRFGLSGVSVALVTLSAMTSVHLAHGGSAAMLADASTAEQVFGTQAFLAVSAVTGLVLAVVLRERARAERRQRVLADVGELLPGADNGAEALERVSKRTVPIWADGSILVLDRNLGSAFAHADPKKVPLLAALAGWANCSWHLPPELVQGVLFSEFRMERIAASLPTPSERRALETLQPTSLLRICLVSDGETLGHWVLFSFGERWFDEKDLSLAKDVGRRLCLSLERLNLLRTAENAVRMRDDFLAIAGHELKTPLTPLSLQVQRLKQNVRSGIGVEEEGLEKLNHQIRRLVGLINDLLDASRIASGRMSLQKTRVPLDALIRDVAANYGEAKQHPIRIETADQDFWVWGDRARLEQVLVNLIDNAIKYSPDGGEIEVRLSAQGSNALLSVKDSGIGIPDEQQGHLFERYFRARNASLQSFGGLGLGLYICRDIVERHGGSIWVQSVAGKGSTFFVRLPRLVSAMDAVKLDDLPLH